MRLDKLLSNMGKGTRSEIKTYIRRKAVTVDGEIAVSGSQIVDADHAVVTLLGERVVYRRFVYLMLHKPEGVISATEDQRHTTVIELVGEEYAHYALFPVGRLDIDTTGLLILTNDGELAHNLLAPKKGIPKTYEVTLAAPISPAQIEALEAGVTLEDGTLCAPARVQVRANKNPQIDLTITEGKFHQVKRMMEAVGNRVTALKRIRMNRLDLDESLEPGAYRELTEAEMASLCFGL
ncbi:MAG: pseudouridine synthase [Bacillota bacterium]|nr:pseudouridine synthase [Bacillota bacterium]